MTDDLTRNSVVGVIEGHAQRQPGAVAVSEPFGGRQLTYAGLWRESGLLADRLLAAGSAGWQAIAVDLPRSAAMVTALLGIVRAGSAYLALDAGAPDGRVADIIAEAGVRAVLTDQGRRPRYGTARSVSPCRPADAGTAELAADKPMSKISATAGQPMYVTYTSGSTGRPKGVVLSHGAVAQLAQARGNWGLGPGDRLASVSNPAFDALTWEIWTALAAGATIVPFPDFLRLGMRKWLDLLQAERISAMLLTTSVFHTVAREHPGALAELTTVLVGGEQLDRAAAAKVLRAGPPRQLINAYGPSEATCISTCYECTADGLPSAGRVPIGQPLSYVRAHVLDDELRAVAPGEVGELCVGGAGLGLGYLGRDDLTSASFVVPPGVGHRVYLTGDLVRRLPSGALELIGRKDSQVKLRGFRIELEEIERTAMASGLLDAAFVCKVGQDAAARLVAAVQPTAAAEGSADLAGKLSAYLAQRLPGYMLPAQWITLDAVPLTDAGKADRAAIAALASAAQAGAEEGADNGAESGQTVVGILGALLGRPDIPDGLSFLDRGGNSLTAVRAAHRIAERLALDVEPADILLSPDLSKLVSTLNEGNAH